ncbi:hypothetical protein [Leifsonia sp. WHRI 6310E]|uniref:hypothetical protein n=1 Tax=Leifsonia sp. WHRI 6310E TaxID=3162562 RepID=UPI0032F06DD2
MTEIRRHPIEQLADDIAITEERTAMLDTMRKRLTIDHSIVLHRDSASAADIRTMLDHLAAAGMPPEATLKVDGTDNHTRMYARWATPTSNAPAAHEGRANVRPEPAAEHPLTDGPPREVDADRFRPAARD